VAQNRKNTQADLVSSKNPTQTLFLRMRNPERILFEGEVKAVSSVNEQGPFDVLQSHSNFISIIKDKIIIYQTNGKSQEITIDNGVLKVLADKINIFLGLEKLKK